MPPVKIDTHMHIYRTKEEGHSRKAGGYVIWEYGDKTDVRFSKYDGDIEDGLDAIESSGFSKAVVVNLFTPDWVRSQFPEHNEMAPPDLLRFFNQWACDLVAPHPQLIPYVGVDPTALPGEDGAAHLRDMVENHGARGIKLHPVLQQFEMGDPRMSPIYRTCVELDVAIIAHSGPARGGEPFAEPKAFAAPLEAFPDLKLVVAHMGGGVWQQTRDFAEAHPNAYFDLCEIIEWTGGTNAPTVQQFAQLIKDIGPERVILGSDFPWYDLDRTVELLMELPVLSNEEKEGIMGANAERILGI